MSRIYCYFFNSCSAHFEIQREQRDGVEEAVQFRKSFNVDKSTLRFIPISHKEFIAVLSEIHADDTLD